jgi:hypothetical protein
MNSTIEETEQTKPVLFPLGRVYVTRGIQALIDDHKLDVRPYIARHQTGDWGDVCAEDAAENQLSLARDFRILSAYSFTSEINGEAYKLWIITEADRSVTTVLLPSEY